MATEQDTQNALADGLWWIDTHAQEIQKSVSRLFAPGTTPEERVSLSEWMNLHVTSLIVAHTKYQELLAWMNDSRHKEELEVPQDGPPEYPDKNAWDADYEGIVHEDDATEDGA